MDKVVVITVTYNDASFLKKCINALLSQTKKVDKIIIVDNNSNQKNKELIKKIICDKTDVLTLENNLGGAGGFNKGMSYAKEKYNPDWYWIMDGDAFPESDCLEKLLKHKTDIQNIGYLAPVIYGVDLNRYQLYHHKKLALFLERDIPLYKNFDEIADISSIEADAFVGPLFSKKCVDDLGVCDGKLFIYGDDLEYTYRITRKYNAILIKEAIINHRDQPSETGVQEPKNWWKDYYMYRNRILFIKKYQRNFLKRIIGILLVYLRCLKQIYIASRSGFSESLLKIRKEVIKKAFADGIKGKTGKTIDPANFIKMVNDIK